MKQNLYYLVVGKLKNIFKQKKMKNLITILIALISFTTFAQIDANAPSKFNKVQITELEPTTSDTIIVSGNGGVLGYVLKDDYINNNWGGIAGNIESQTDLVNYIENQIQQIPKQNLQDVLDQTPGYVYAEFPSGAEIEDDGGGLSFISTDISIGRDNHFRYKDSDNSFSINSNLSNFKGLTGSQYFGQNYTDNSFVQKKYVDDKLDATETWVNNQGFLDSIPTLQEVTSQGAITTDAVQLGETSRIGTFEFDGLMQGTGFDITNHRPNAPAWSFFLADIGKGFAIGTDNITSGDSNLYQLPANRGTLALIEDIPSITGLASETYVDDAIAAIPDATIGNITDIPLRSYNDLQDKPTIPSVSGLASETYVDNAVFSGSYNDLTNKPTIPSVTGLASETYVDNAVAAIPDETIGNITDIPLRSYNDLQDKIQSGSVTLLSGGTDTTDRIWSANDLAIWGSNSFIQRSMLSSLATKQYVDDAVETYEVVITTGSHSVASVNSNDITVVFTNPGSLTIPPAGQSNEGKKITFVSHTGGSDISEDYIAANGDVIPAGKAINDNLIVIKSIGGTWYQVNKQY